MQPSARIAAIRLAEKAARQPEYAKRIGLHIENIRRPGRKGFEQPKKCTEEK